MFDCFRTGRSQQIVHVVVGDEDTSSTDEQMNSGPRSKRSGATVRTRVPSESNDGSTVRQTLKETVRTLDEAIQAERTTLSDKYVTEPAAKVLIDQFDAEYQTLREDRLAGVATQAEIERRATALGTLLARACGLADENGWTAETRRRCKTMGDTYVENSVFINDASSALLIAKTLLGLCLDIGAMASPAHGVALKGAKIGFNLGYAVVQSFVTCCVGTVGAGTNQSDRVSRTSHEAPGLMPDQPTTSYMNPQGKDVPPPSLPHVKDDLRLVTAVAEALLGGSDERVENLLTDMERRRSRTERKIDRMKSPDENGNAPVMTGPQQLERSRLNGHLQLIRDLVSALQPAEENSSGGQSDGSEVPAPDYIPGAPRITNQTLLSHMARLIDELAVGDRITRTNVQKHVGDGKWLRAMLNMINGLLSLIKAAHEIASDVSGFDAGKITATVASLTVSIAQMLIYRSTQGSASGKDHCNKIASLFALISQTERGNIRAKDSDEIDHDKLNALVIGPRMIRMKNLNKALQLRSMVLMSAIIGHIKGTALVTHVDTRDGRQVALTFTSLQTEFNSILKAKQPIDAFVNRTLKKLFASVGTKEKVERLLEQLKANEKAAGLAKNGELKKLRKQNLLHCDVMRVIVGSLQHAEHMYEDAGYDAEAHRCDEQLSRWAAELEIRVRSANGQQIASKAGVTAVNFVGGNGSFYAAKAAGSVASGAVQLGYGLDEPDPCSDWIDLVTALISCCGPVVGSTSGYAYPSVRLKNLQRAEITASGVVEPPNTPVHASGVSDLFPAFSWDTLRQRVTNFDTLLPPFIDPQDMPPPYDYECETSILGYTLDQVTKQLPVDSRFVERWAGRTARRPGALDLDPTKSLASARQLGEATESDVSSGSDSHDPYHLKKGRQNGDDTRKTEQNVNTLIPDKVKQRKGGQSGGNGPTNGASSGDSSSSDDGKLTSKRVLKGTPISIDEYADRVPDLY